jgi:hypothetical protein
MKSYGVGETADGKPMDEKQMNDELARRIEGRLSDIIVNQKQSDVCKEVKSASEITVTVKK